MVTLLSAAFSRLGMPSGSDSSKRPMSLPAVKDKGSRVCKPSIAAPVASLFDLLLAKKGSAGSLETARSSVPALTDDSIRNSPGTTAGCLSSREYTSTSEILAQCSAFPFAGESRIPSTSDRSCSQKIANETFASPGSRVGSIGTACRVEESRGATGCAQVDKKLFPGPASFAHTEGDITTYYEVMPGASPLASGGFSSVYFTWAWCAVTGHHQLQVLKVTPKVERLAHDLESMIMCDAAFSRMPFVAWGGGLFDLGPHWAYNIVPLRYYPNGSLHERSGSRRPNDFVMLNWMVQLLLGLRWLHLHSYVHCDLKASNVLIDEYGRVVLCDFGLSVFVPDVRNLPLGTFQRTPIPFTGGTPGYLAPEARDGCSSLYDITPAVDVYGLAVLWLEMWDPAVVDELDGFGDEPYYTRLSKVQAVVERTIPSKCTSFDLAPLKQLIVKMLSISPYNRPTLDEILQNPFFDTVFDFNDVESGNLAQYLL